MIHFGRFAPDFVAAVANSQNVANVTNGRTITPGWFPALGDYVSRSRVGPRWNLVAGHRVGLDRRYYFVPAHAGKGLHLGEYNPDHNALPGILRKKKNLVIRRECCPLVQHTLHRQQQYDKLTPSPIVRTVCVDIGGEQFVKAEVGA